MTYQKRALLFCLILIGTYTLPSEVIGQAIDFEAKPAMPVDYKRADINLKFDATTDVIEGEVTYTFSARQPVVDSLYLHAGRIDIKEIKVDGQPTEFRTTNDSLTVRLGKPIRLMNGQTHSLNITYQAQPDFGVHRTSNSIRFTSLLPMSTMHWLPVQNHPNNTFTVTWQFELPKGWMAVANGGSSKDGITWGMDRPIPASELAWAVGPIQMLESTIGVKKVRVFYPTGANKTQSEMQELLSTAYQQFRKVESEMGREFPFPSMNFVWLPDHRWETDATAAGWGYIFGNVQNPELQIIDRMIGQWYGVGLRMSQWAESQGMQLYRARMLDAMEQVTDLLKKTDHPRVGLDNLYDQQDLAHTVRWTRLWDTTYTTSYEQQMITFAVEQTTDDIVQQVDEVFTWEQLSDLWYEQTGAPNLNPMSLPNWPVSDTLVYDVTIAPHDTEPVIDVIFQAQDSSYLELVNAEAVFTSFGEITKQEFTFTGELDTVQLKTEMAPDNVQIRILDSLNNTIPVLNVSKPAGFWLSQLREGETVADRVEAANGLRNHLEEPDLQLALNDALENESSDEVKAALLPTMNAFTKGATGTAQTFLNYAGSDNQPLKIAAVEALGSYPENESVSFRLQALIRGDQSNSVRIAALKSYRAVSEAEVFSQFVQKTLDEDTPAEVTNVALSQVFATGDTTAGTVLASQRIQASYPYSIRAHAFDLLVTYAPKADGWDQRYKLLEQDSDPRIRFLLVQAAESVSLSNSKEAIKRIQSREYDERVLKAISNVIQGKSAVSSWQ